MGRFKLWIITIVSLFVVGFLVAFAPVRPVPKGAPEATFRFLLAQPVVQPGGSLDSVSGQIQAELRDKLQQDMNYAKFISPTELEVATWATTEEAADRDRATTLQHLRAKYPGVQEETLPDAPERPLRKLGNVLAIYKPRPQFRLGLDLQGGAHVVLLAKPQTTMSFVSPEDRPMIDMQGQPGAAPGAETPPEGATTSPASATSAAAATPTALAAPKPPRVAGLQQPEEIERNLRMVLQRIGTDPNTVKVEAIVPTRVIVTTQAPDQKVADAQAAAIAGYLQNAYPGVQITKDKADSIFLEPDTAEKVRKIVETRIYSMGVREAIVQTQGQDRVIVELPGVRDPKRVIELLGKTALLQFCLIPDKYEPPAGGIPGEKTDYSLWTNKYTRQSVPWEAVYAESKVEFTGRDLKSNARVQPGQALELVVAFELRDERKEAFRKFTGSNVGRYMAIVLDGDCQMAPVIRSEIPGSGIIEGNFSPAEARDLQLLLNAGALPVPLEVAENRTVSATLGADSIRQSLFAGMIGLVLVLVFMAGYYRVPGLLADLALALYMILLTAVLAMANATLTLPGIAAFIMSLGMAVDANVLIFERLKEELYAGKSPRSAVAAGFDRAWTAILDSNVTTLIGASVLYFLGTASIKSFAVTLLLGIVVHVFTAVTVSRWFVTMFCATRYGQTLSHYGVTRLPGSADEAQILPK